MDTVDGQTPSETEEAALEQEEPEVMALTGEKVNERERERERERKETLWMIVMHLDLLAP
jgi:hypothetical protein